MAAKKMSTKAVVAWMAAQGVVSSAALLTTACGSAPAPPEPTGSSEPGVQLHTSAASGGLATDGGSADSVSSIQAYRDSFYTDADIRHSFTTKFGEPVDCIDFYAQRSVKGFLAQGVQISDQNRPTVIPQSSAPDRRPTNYPSSPDAFDGTLDPDGNARACPSGSVPSRRPTLAQVQSAGGLAAFRSAISAAERRPPRAAESTQQYDCYQYTTGGPSFDHAAGYQDFPNGVSGINTFAALYNPSIEYYGVGEHSISQLWVETGTCENDSARTVSYNCTTGTSGNAVQSVEVGAIVGTPYAAGTPHLFVFSTQDGYNQTGCYAGSFNANCCPSPTQSGEGTDCFVAFSSSNWEVGQALTPGTPGQTPVEIVMQAWNPGYNNQWGWTPGWYIWINGSLMGAYPSAAFAGTGKTGQLQFSATYLQVGGEVFDDNTDGIHTTTQMGSGDFFGSSSSPYGQAAYHRNVTYLQGLTYTNASLSYVSDSPNSAGLCGWQASGSYGLSTTYAQGPGASWGSYFYYGGPQ